jgi:hypothetical protein
MSQLEFESSEALVQELLNRFDCAVFVARKKRISDKEQGHLYCHATTGDEIEAAGLCEYAKSCLINKLGKKTDTISHEDM